MLVHIPMSGERFGSYALSFYVCCFFRLLHEVCAARVPFDYIAFDTHYTTGKNTRALTRMGITWHGTLSPRTIVFWRGQRLAVRELAPLLKLRWRKQVQVRATMLTVETQTY